MKLLRGSLVICIALSVPHSLAGNRFAFGAFGDTPYFAFEEVRLEKLFADMNAQPLAFVVHIGDIKSARDPCDDKLYRKRKALFDTIRHPFVITPGDNDWTDCHRQSSGHFDPLDRLRLFRELFYAAEPALPVEHESALPDFADYVENMRWILNGVAFITLHVVGSNNNYGRATEADVEYRARNAADLYWLRESFSLARERGLAGLVIAMHADAHLEAPAARQAATGFGDLVQALREETQAFGRPVLLIHGDSHRLRYDHPLRTPTGEPIVNFSRLEVFGAPTAGWVKVSVDPGADPMFAVEPHK